MFIRKKTCYFPQATRKPFAIHHTDHGIFSELTITNVGAEAVVAALIVNDEFHPSVEVGGKVWFHPLRLPRRLRFGASLAVALQAPAFYVRPEDCYKGYPKKVTVRLTGGEAITFGLWDIIRCKG